MNITAEQVKQLRELTGVGMMECKKALVETEGNLDEAVDWLRKSGQLRASKKAGRIAAEGIIVIAAKPDKKSVLIMEVNCETDFVAKDENFNGFANKTAELALTHQIEDLNHIAELAIEPGKTVEQARQELIAKIGENVTVRRAKLITFEEPIGFYNHGGRIGSVIVLKGGNDTVKKDLSMQVAASKPLVLFPEDISEEVVAKEREIYLAQNENSNKPADIIEKMIDGKIRKFVDEVSFVGQPFVKDPSIKVADYLKQNNAQAISFTRFEVGEGIEKVVTDFAAEVMAQVRGS